MQEHNSNYTIMLARKDIVQYTIAKTVWMDWTSKITLTDTNCSDECVD